METKTKNILVPFVGFYESIASEKMKDIAFRDFVMEKGIKENADGRMDVPEDMIEEEQDQFWDYYDKKYKEYQEQVAQDYLYALAVELGLTMKFESIDSPRQYNFTTDRLFVDVPEDQLMELYNKLDQRLFAEVIKERHTSRPGFNSFYANDIDDPEWSDPTQYDHNQWETVVDTYIKQINIELSELYYI